VIQGPKRRGSNRLPRVFFWSRRSRVRIPSLTLTNLALGREIRITRSPTTCGRGEHAGEHLSLRNASSRSLAGGHRSRFRSSRLATNRRRAAIERGEEVDAARRLDTERPVAPIRVRLADWFERALRREQSVPASRV
jgi:hypothetical protein